MSSSKRLTITITCDVPILKEGDEYEKFDPIIVSDKPTTNVTTDAGSDDVVVLQQGYDTIVIRKDHHLAELIAALQEFAAMSGIQQMR